VSRGTRLSRVATGSVFTLDGFLGPLGAAPTRPFRGDALEEAGDVPQPGVIITHDELVPAVPVDDVTSAVAAEDDVDVIKPTVSELVIANDKAAGAVDTVQSNATTMPQRNLFFCTVYLGIVVTRSQGLR
jgi:hypothetical protein